MIATQDIDAIIGSEAVGPDNDRIGKVGQVYIDQDANRPVWVSVKSGLFGTSESLVPLEGADWDQNALHLAFSKDRVKDAPRVDPDAELSPQEQERLYDYYGMGHGTSGSTDDGGLRDRGTTGGSVVDDPIASDRDRYTAAGGGEGTVGNAGSGADREAGYDSTTDRGTVGHDTSGPTTDDAMTRSEERLNVGTQKVETGRARLRKYVVTDQQTVNVPVQHEEVRIEREPITDANRGAAFDGPDLSDEEHEVVLTEERPVVQKETVPVERVRLDKETVTDQQQVTEDVRHEEITTDDDGTGRTAR
ncbi:DUF2382 domain-containing protein [Amnibacterium setariae]|uniref:DUF2382 domain-containing protein n=1 Tax=Amnibacterium setariae TaxID=2306585 RepID=A0A3A1TTN7_9MICO|nr:PRC and DUF2382 domain-containing protein [Amnibacterium setariae]RIX26451.1 DUF2382 domain-containing protein [Amnibacterium setariae]